MSILFIFILSSSSATHNSKTTRCMQILYIPNDCSATEHLPFLVWGRRTSYDWRAMAKKRSQSMQDERVRRLLGLLFTKSGCGTYSQATPGLLNACVTVCDEFSRQLPASRSWTTVFSIYLMLKTILVPRKTPLCI